MRGYSEREVFSPELAVLWRRATAAVKRVAGDGPPEIRCHELARAVGVLLGLPRECVQDGYYGFVDHTWLWVPRPPKDPVTKRLGWPHILDVYSVGQLPMVRLVVGGNPNLPHVGWSYRPDSPRADVDWGLVERLVLDMREARACRRGLAAGEAEPLNPSSRAKSGGGA